MLQRDPTDSDDEDALLIDLSEAQRTEADRQASQLQKPQKESYLAYFGRKAKLGVVSYVGILGGSIAAYTVAPMVAARAVSYVTAANPMTLPIVPILSFSVAASTVALANAVSYKGTEVALDSAGIALMYMYEGGMSSSKPKENTTKAKAKLSNQHRRERKKTALKAF